MAEKSDGELQWRPLDDEELTRHQALFYSQSPIEGLLPGEKARDLLLRSQLALPVLSQIWNLVDTPHDNMLDAGEFAMAMHLVRGYLRGLRLPRAGALPPHLRVASLEEVQPPAISVRELLAYTQLFEVLDTTRLGYLDAVTTRDLLVTSGLPVEQLARVWNLADVDRDGRLNRDEFAITCHMVRFLKQGGKLNGPVNVQSLLPHRTRRHDLQAKRRGVADLKARKLRLMALREKRKTQCIAEEKRALLHRERLHCLRLWHAVLSDNDSVSVETILHFGDRLKEEEDAVVQLELASQRLKDAHAQILQETARVIMHEQRLSQEVTSLEKEADLQRKKRQRNSLIKDLDPFHQLHEDRKEERLMGAKRLDQNKTPEQQRQEQQKSKPQPKVEIPHIVDPFDRSKLHHKPLSGQEIFGVPQESGGTGPGTAAWLLEAKAKATSVASLDESLSSNHRRKRKVAEIATVSRSGRADVGARIPSSSSNHAGDSSSWAVKGSIMAASGSGGGGGGGTTAWGGPVDGQLSELTHGFEDDFVDVWAHLSQGTPVSKLLDNDADQDANLDTDDTEDNDGFFRCTLDNEELVFRTVSVTAEEDDLWCGLAPEQLAQENEQLKHLHLKLTSLQQQIEQLGHQRVVMETPPERCRSAEPPSWQNPLTRRRISSEGTLECVTSPVARSGLAGAALGQRRNYGEAYNRARLLHDFAARRRGPEVQAGAVTSSTSSGSSPFSSASSPALSSKSSAESSPKELHSGRESLGKTRESLGKTREALGVDADDSTTSLSARHIENRGRDTTGVPRTPQDASSSVVEEARSDRIGQRTQLDSSSSSSVGEDEIVAISKPKPEGSDVKQLLERVLGGSGARDSGPRPERSRAEERHIEETGAEDAIVTGPYNVTRSQEVPLTPTQSVHLEVGSKEQQEEEEEGRKEVGEEPIQQLKVTAKAEPLPLHKLDSLTTADHTLGTPHSVNKTGTATAREDIIKSVKADKHTAEESAGVGSPSKGQNPAQVVRRDRSPGSAAGTSANRVSLPPNFFSAHLSPVPPPRKNSPRKKRENAQASRTGSSGASSSSASSSSSSDAKESPLFTVLPADLKRSPSAGQSKQLGSTPEQQQHSPAPVNPVGAELHESSLDGSPQVIDSPQRSSTSDPEAAGGAVGRAPSYEKASPQLRQAGGRGAHLRPHSIAYLEGPDDGPLDYPPVPPPRTKKRRSRQDLSSSSFSSSTPERSSESPTAAVVVEVGKHVGARGASGVRRDKDQSDAEENPEGNEKDMEAQQRRLELERMRANLFGYSHDDLVESSVDADEGEEGQGEGDRQTNTVVLTLSDDDLDAGGRSSAASRHQNRVLLDLDGASSKPNPKRAPLSPGAEGPYKTNVQLDFTNNNNNQGSDEGLVKPQAVTSAHERLDSLIRDGPKSAYRTVLELTEDDGDGVTGRLGKNSPSALQPPLSETSRIVLDLDQHQYRPDVGDKSLVDVSVDDSAPSASPALTAEEEYLLQNRVSSGGVTTPEVYKTDLYFPSQNGGHRSAAVGRNRNKAEDQLTSDASMDADSDLSDEDATFEATFEPDSQKHLGSIPEATRTCIKLDDDGDSGITLVSYHSRSHSDSLDDERIPTPTKTAVTSSEVVLNLAPLSPPTTGGGTSLSATETPSAPPRLVKVTRDDPARSPTTTTPATTSSQPLKMDARSSIVTSKEDTGNTKAVPASIMSFRDELLELDSHRETEKPISMGFVSLLESTPSSPPPPTMTPLSRPEEKRAFSSPPKARTLGPPPQLSANVGDGGGRGGWEVGGGGPRSHVPDHDLSSVAQSTGTTVFQSAGSSSRSADWFDDDALGSPATGTNDDPQRERTTKAGDVIPTGGPRSLFTGTATTLSTAERLQQRQRQQRLWEESEGRRVTAEGERSDTTTTTTTTSESGGPGRSGSSSGGGGGGSSFSPPSHGKGYTDSKQYGRLYQAGGGSSTSNTSTSTAHQFIQGRRDTQERTQEERVAGQQEKEEAEEEEKGVKSMDPITGLRKTGPVSAVDKAVTFVAKTEPSFRVRRKEDPLPAGSDSSAVDGGRATLIEAMRVRRKPLDWMAPFDGVDATATTTTATAPPAEKSESERLYEQRKLKNEQNKRKEVGSVVVRGGKDGVYPSEVISTLPADIDATSINQETTKKLWEEQFASGEATLFPRPPDASFKRSISNLDVTNFKSEVETESIGTLRDVKKQWEQKAEEMAKEKEDRDRRISTSKSFDSLTFSKSSALTAEQQAGQQAASPPVTSRSYNEGLSRLARGPDDNQYESALDREVRLAEERERELKEARQTRNRESTAVAPPRASNNTSNSAPADVATVDEVVEEDAVFIETTATGEPISSPRESIIEREIKEQQMREEQLRHEGKLQTVTHTNKEHEQSEYERQEKEQERINAHESIVEREIRLQRERELELMRLRSQVYQQHGQKDTPTEYTNGVGVVGVGTDRDRQAPPAAPPAPPPPPPPVGAATATVKVVDYQQHPETTTTSTSRQEVSVVSSTTAISPPTPSPSAARDTVDAVLLKSEAQAPLLAEGGPDHAAHVEISSGPRPVVALQSSQSSYSLRSSEQSQSQSQQQAPPVKAGMSSSISYEDAISTYAHAGESLIARELREQKEREEELRRRWKEEYGLESPLQPGEAADTPYNMPEPVQPPPPPRLIQATGQQSHQSRGGPAVRTHLPGTNPTVVTASAAATASVNIQPGKPQQGSPPVLIQASNSAPAPRKVQPLAVDGNDRDSYRYVPQHETPIEREIRLAREREEEFRQMKGISGGQGGGGGQGEAGERAGVILDGSGPLAMRPQALLHRKGEEPPAERATMKRLANSRLQQEIAVEKQRELDLQRLGHISTTSEDRKDNATRYVEIVPLDPTPPPPPPPTAPGKTPPPPAVTPTAAVKTPTTPTVDATDGKPAAVGSAGSGGGARKASKAGGGGRSAGELKIEQELREMREREEELMNQRQVTSHRLVIPGDTAQSNGSASNEYQAPKLSPAAPSSVPGDQLSKGPRRKSTLAEEWERKFSSTS